MKKKRFKIDHFKIDQGESLSLLLVKKYLVAILLFFLLSLTDHAGAWIIKILHNF
jgi:hypothetical protein